MIKINLLPEELRESQRVRRVKINIAAIVGAALSITILCIVIVFTIVGQRMRDAARVRGQIERLKPQAQEAEALIKKKQQLLKEYEMLDTLAVGRILWSILLNDVGDVMPPDLFLTKLSYNPRQQKVLIMKGEAVPGHGIESVVEFIDSLKRSHSFVLAFPQVDYSIENIEHGGKSFEIRCVRAKTAEKK
ncbi:MAG: hypothetical protein NTZ78_11145 [Candidatus Aureabacteria bacterium]|nr:hypothetical protein [Candidatus Auribacterota bacterium]